MTHFQAGPPGEVGLVTGFLLWAYDICHEGDISLQAVIPCDGHGSIQILLCHCERDPVEERRSREVLEVVHLVYTLGIYVVEQSGLDYALVQLYSPLLSQLQALMKASQPTFEPTPHV